MGLQGDTIMINFSASECFAVIANYMILVMKVFANLGETLI